jgi:hypothetical protein
VILEEARVRAREITAAAEAERERVRVEIRRLKALEADVRANYRGFLLLALDRLDADSGERRAPDQAA